MNKSKDAAITREKFWEILNQLAEITTNADCLKYELEPLSDDDIAAGAEPLTQKQIAERLNAISILATKIALHGMQATSAEWLSINDTIE